MAWLSIAALFCTASQGGPARAGGEPAQKPVVKSVIHDYVFRQTLHVAAFGTHF